MKKLILGLSLMFFTVQLTAQTMAFSVLEVKMKPFTQDNMTKAFEQVFEGVEMNKGGIVLERFTAGRRDGMTHRMVFMYTLGEKMIADEFWASDKNDAFWSKMGNYVEEWGNSYSGRILSWKEGDTDKTPQVHIWDIVPENSQTFKAAHDQIVSEYKAEFKDRVVGFGTYDVGLPNGASHWIALTGKDTQDHLMFYDEMEKKGRFVELLQARGDFELIKDFELKILKRM